LAEAEHFYKNKSITEMFVEVFCNAQYQVIYVQREVTMATTQIALFGKKYK